MISKTFLLAAISLLFVSLAEAHVGDVPILKINGEFVVSDVFDNTQEYAEVGYKAPQASYPIESEIEYEIEPTYTPIELDVLKNTNFVWDFGDGSVPLSGKYLLAVTHAYPKEGIYILKISMDSDHGMEVVQVVPIVIGNPQATKEESLNYLVPQATEGETPSYTLMGTIVIAAIGFTVGYTFFRKNKNHPQV
jgi:hypothetical protein